MILLINLIFIRLTIKAMNLDPLVQREEHPLVGFSSESFTFTEFIFSKKSHL